MKIFSHLFFYLIFFTTVYTQDKISNLDSLFAFYINAVNTHNIEAIDQITDEYAIWILGNDTLNGKTEVLLPNYFDLGANTNLKVSYKEIREDTIDFEITETNNVLTAYGIQELHHFPRMIFKNNKIWKTYSRRPPLEIEEFISNVIPFMKWLKTENPIEYEKIYPNDKFNYSEYSGKTMPKFIKKWKSQIK